MICACCQRDNPPGHAFCHGCGAALSTRPTQAAFASVVVCPSCGATHAPGLQSCRECGFEHRSGPGPRPATGGPPAPPTRTAGAARAQLVVVQRDGSDGAAYPIRGERVDIGGREGDIVLREDPYLSPRHARIERRSGSFVLLDLGSTNGIYVRLREPEPLADGDMILIGQQVLRFEISSEAERQVGPARQHGVMVFGTPEQPRLGRLIQYTTEGLARDVHYLQRNETILGREAADLTFSDDPFLSRRHAAVVLHAEDRRFVLRDLGSSNGTALRCRAERVLSSGDQFRLGRHLFRFDVVASEGEGQIRV